MAFYQDLDDDVALPDHVVISDMYVVASLEISISDANSQGLALRLHSYPSDIAREGYWAPPNLQYQVNKNYEAPQLGPDLLRHFNDYVESNAASMLEDITLLAESFGLRGAVVRRLSEPNVIEVKPSINQPRRINAFCTVRFALTSLKEHSEANLVDREARHGFVILPLGKEALRASVHSAIDAHGDGDSSLYYLGKPLMSGLQKLIKDETTLERIRSRSIDVRHVATRRSEFGIIAVADIAGYGRVLTTQYLGLIGDPNQERREYQARALRALELALTATGTTQVQTAGDGFVAGYPTKPDRHARGTFLEVIRHWSDTVRLIEGDINTALARANNSARLGSRIAIGQGDYEWGRINGIDSFSPAFNGPAVVDAVRLEQGLNAFVGENVDGARMTGHEHVLALDSGVAESERDNLNALAALGWVQLGVHRLRAKERWIEGAHLFKWQPA